MTDNTFHRGMEAMAAAWPSRNVNQSTLDVYWLVLRELHDSVFDAAVAACLRSAKFFPAPAEILEKAREVLAVAEVLPVEADEAWNQVLQALRQWSDAPDWPQPQLPPLVAQAVRALGGMRRVAYCELKDLGYLRKEFVDFYAHKRRMEIDYTPDLLRQALPAPASRAQLPGAPEAVQAMVDA